MEEAIPYTQPESTQKEFNIDSLPAPLRSRMQSFMHVVDMVFEYQRKLDNGEKWWWKVRGEDGNFTNEQIPITYAMLDSMSNISLDMLTSFQQNEQMHQMAISYVMKKSNEQKEAERMATDKINNLFNDNNQVV